METMPEIGTRVRFHSEVNGRVRECTGTVVAQYAGFPSRDENDEPYMTPDAVGVRVDEIPEWWPYPDTDRFAPDVCDLEPMGDAACADCGESADADDIGTVCRHCGRGIIGEA